MVSKGNYIQIKGDRGLFRDIYGNRGDFMQICGKRGVLEVTYAGFMQMCSDIANFF